MPSTKPTFQVRFNSRSEIQMIQKAAQKLEMSMNRLVTVAAREVAKTILASNEAGSKLIETSSELTLNQ